MSKTSTRRIIAVSEKVKGEIQREYLIDAKRLVVIHHGVDLEAFHPRNRSIMRASVRSQLGLAEDDFVVLFVGGEYRLKGLKTLLEAAKGLSPRLRILAIGVNTGPALNQLVGDTGLSNRVTFVQHTDQMASLHSAADCFALPTLYDTFSLATLEAMASGLPVIVSRAAGVSEILHPGHDCLILDDPEDVDVLAHHLVQVLDNEAVRNRLGDQSRKTAERHSWDGVVDRTLEVYRTVVSGSL